MSGLQTFLPHHSSLITRHSSLLASLLAVDREGLAPSFPACGAGVVLLDQQPATAIANCKMQISNFQFAICNCCAMIPDGLEPSLPGCGPGVVAAGPRDRIVAEVGIEPTNSHQALDLAALPICVLGRQLRKPDSNRRQTAYETVLETNSSPLRSDQGESRTPMPRRRDVLSVVCLPVPPLGLWSGVRGQESGVRQPSLTDS